MEHERLAALRSHGIMDTAQSEAFDRLVELAAQLFGAPIALVSLVDDERQWFKAKLGLDVCSTPREQAFCAHALALDRDAVMVVEDAAADPRFADSPLVVGPPHIRFYAGALLTDSAGHNLGTLCVIDTAPRQRPTGQALDKLRALARITVREIEHVKADQMATERARLLSMAESMSGVGHWRYDARVDQVTWSDEVYRIHGLSPQGFNPNLDSVTAYYHEADRPTLLRYVTRALSEGVDYQFELRIWRADGALRDVLAKASCEFDEAGRVVALFGVFQDITEHRQALRQARESQARYQLITDNVADVITRLRLDGSSLYISGAIQSLLGYSPAEMALRGPDGFVYAEDRPGVDKAFAAMAAGLDQVTVQHRAMHRDGRLIWLETRFRTVTDESEPSMQIVGVIRDITEQRRLEEDLRLARRQAEEASAVKSEFLANMSHELRTPLTSIIGFTGLAARQADISAPTRLYIQRVESASRALLSTVNDVLDFSKLEAGQVTITPQPTDLIDLCRDCLDMFAPQAAARDVGLRLILHASHALVVLIDPDRLRQILLNLIGNAVKFTAQGSVALEVGYDPGQERIRISVRDTGAGLSADKQKLLFKRFSQVDGSLTRMHNGTGLGLAICKGLVEAMGGEIGVDSVEGAGSCFWFSVPAPACAASTMRRGGELAGGQSLFAGVRVLVVDDHPANRELARLFLAGGGAEVTEAVDGAAAVEAARYSPFDAILMDVRMPTLDGLGALRQIREGGGPNDATPIIAYTADATVEEAVRLKAAGFDDIVAKPVDAAALINAVAAATSFEAAPDELAATAAR